MSGKRKKELPKRQLSVRLLAFIGLAGLLAVIVGAAGPALATGGGGSDDNDNFKVFVCKYVDTPGVDERLQTGQNPISVSVNSIPDYQGVGSYFADRHGRSFVLAVDDTPPGPAGDPDVSACPPPDNPPDVIQIPAAPQPEDPCGPNNATWIEPSDTDVLDWELLDNGHLTVTITAENTTFPGGATSHDYGTAPDSGEVCEPEEPTVVPVPTQETVDLCNPHGVSNNVAWQGSLPADTATVDWSESNNGATRTATLIGDNVEWSDGTTAPKVFNLPADSGVECDEPTEPEGNLVVSFDCNSITIGEPTGVKPEDAEVVIMLDGEVSQPGTYTVESGIHVVNLHVNGERVDSEEFMVEDCPEEPTPVSPTEPTLSDVCEPVEGSTFDTYTIPNDPNFTYTVNDADTDPGTHPAELTEYVIVAVPNEGVVVEEGAQTEWTFPFSKGVCETPPVIAPDGSISVDCKGKGVAVADNSESTTSFGFEVVVNGQATLYSLDAGEVREIKFSGAKPGSLVILQDGEATELDSARVPLKCGKDNPPPDDDNPPKNPDTPDHPTTPPHAGMGEGGSSMTGTIGLAALASAVIGLFALFGGRRREVGEI